MTHLLQAEDGPWNVITRLRGAVGNSVLGDLLDCFYCLSLWVAAPAAYALGRGYAERFWLWPALSGAAILLERFAQKPPTIIGGEFGEDKSIVLPEQQSDSSITDKSQL